MGGVVVTWKRKGDIMKLRYIIYNIKCQMQKTQPIDYIDWLAEKLFLHKWKGEKHA